MPTELSVFRTVSVALLLVFYGVCAADAQSTFGGLTGTVPTPQAQSFLAPQSP